MEEQFRKLQKEVRLKTRAFWPHLFEKRLQQCGNGFVNYILILKSAQKTASTFGLHYPFSIQDQKQLWENKWHKSGEKKGCFRSFRLHIGELPDSKTHKQHDARMQLASASNLRNTVS